MKKAGRKTLANLQLYHKLIRHVGRELTRGLESIDVYHMVLLHEEMATEVQGVLAKRRKIDEITTGEDKNKNSDTRPLCRYGSRCFRVNPQHKLEFRHANDQERDVKNTEISRQMEISRGHTQYSAADNREKLPLCKLGVDCTDMDLVHFAEFWHPTCGDEMNRARTEDQNQGDSDWDRKQDEVHEVEECDFGEVSGGYEMEATQLICDEYDEDEEGANSESQTSLPKDDTVLSRGPSILKCYSILTEEERKDLIRRAFELKNLLKDELQRTLDVIEKKNKELRKVHSQLEKGHLMVDGEEEAMEREELVYFPLFAEREFKEGSAAQIHFRLAESQFYRLVDTADKYRITKVDYVINPILIKKFKTAREKLWRVRGEKLSYPVLAFHGTKKDNIDSICHSGFRMPGDSNFEHATDTGYYGRGVYFSEYPSYSMEYIRGATKLLLCQVLPGKVFRCTKLIHGEPLESGNDSHTSPDGKELVIFNPHHILPSYVVHYGEAKGDFQYS